MIKLTFQTFECRSLEGNLTAKTSSGRLKQLARLTKAVFINACHFSQTGLNVANVTYLISRAVRLTRDWRAPLNGIVMAD